MKSFKLIISKLGLEQLCAYADESYLYRYVVNNYTELDDTNIFNNPDLYQALSKESLLFVKFDIGDDDEIAINDAMYALKKKNATFYGYVFDEESGAFFVYKNFSGKINLPVIDNFYKNIDDFSIVTNIEKYVDELEYNNEFDDEMEM